MLNVKKYERAMEVHDLLSVVNYANYDELLENGVDKLNIQIINFQVDPVDNLDPRNFCFYKHNEIFHSTTYGDGIARDSLIRKIHCNCKRSGCTSGNFSYKN